jgi:GNAT superfamily N-acetyltransferase
VKLAFRPASSESDLTFVISSWLDATKHSYSAGLIAMDDWYAVMWPQYVKASKRDGMQTIVAYEETDAGFLYGCIVADPTDQRIPEKDGSVRWYPGLVLFVFVKQSYRREGIARQLFKQAGIEPHRQFLYGCNTQQASRLASKVPAARFNPLAGRYPKERRT